MSTKNQSIIHIGLHKTATTTLQDRVFPYLKGLTYHHQNELLPLYRHLALTDPAFLDLEQFKNKVTGRCKPGVNLFSAELFSGLPSKAYMNRSNMQGVLKEIFGQVKILLIIREQSDWLRSYYKHYLKHGGTANIDEFVYEYGKSPCQETFIHLRSLEYDKFVDSLRISFGFENIKVMFFEKLKFEPENFLNDLAEFMEADAGGIDLRTSRKSGVGFSEAYLLWQKRLNYLRRSSFHRGPLPMHPQLFRQINKLMPKGERRYFSYFERYRSHYSTSNKRLANLLGTKLPDNYYDG